MLRLNSVRMEIDSDRLASGFHNQGFNFCSIESCSYSENFSLLCS